MLNDEERYLEMEINNVNDQNCGGWKIMAMDITNNFSSYVASNTDITKKSDSKAAMEVKANSSANSKNKVQAYYEQLCK